MQLTPEIQKQIDSMDFETLIRHQRFDPIGDPWWTGDVGAAMSARLVCLQAATPSAEQVAVSKKIGWDV